MEILLSTVANFKYMKFRNVCGNRALSVCLVTRGIRIYVAFYSAETFFFLLFLRHNLRKKMHQTSFSLGPPKQAYLTLKFVLSTHLGMETTYFSAAKCLYPIVLFSNCKESTSSCHKKLFKTYLCPETNPFTL